MGGHTGQEPLLWSKGHRAPAYLSSGGREGRTVSCTCPGTVRRLETLSEANCGIRFTTLSRSDDGLVRKFSRNSWFHFVSFLSD